MDAPNQKSIKITKESIANKGIKVIFKEVFNNGGKK